MNVVQNSQTFRVRVAADRGAVTWAASALDTENEFSCKYTARQASEQAVRAIQVAHSGKL